MSKILIVSPYATVAPHFETELEIAQRHLDQGDEVTVLSCVGELSACDFNPLGDFQRCQECSLRRADGWRRIKGKIKLRNFERCSNRSADHSPLPVLDTVAQLKRCKIDEFDIGNACLSSLVSCCRNPDPDLNAHGNQLERFMVAAQQVYRATLKYLDRHRPDCVYVFNGRFAPMRAVLSACRARNVCCRIHERGCDTHHFQLHENHLPHDIQYIAQRMQSAWKQADRQTRRDEAAKWYQGRVDCLETTWHSFVKQQTGGQLPSDWNARRHNIGLFTSSEDEFVAVGECWTNRLYPNQVMGVARLAHSLARAAPSAHLTVRMHPNLRGLENDSVRNMLAVNLDNVTIVPPESPVDSYGLLRACDTIACFGSSIGIEAAFWGKPSVLLGPCFYQGLGSVYRAADHAEAVRLLSSPLVPRPDEGALIYGYWQQTHGIRFRYFKPDGLFHGTFKGEVIYAKQPKTLARRLRRTWRSLFKRLHPVRRQRRPRTRRAA